MPWETFDKRAGRLVKAPELTVQSAGTISLNAAAANLLGDTEAIELLYDHETHRVGIRPVAADAAHAYPLRPVTPERSTFVINSRAFFNYYRLPIGTAIRRDVRMEDGVLILDLNEPGREVISNRKRKTTTAATAAANGTNGPAVPDQTSEGAQSLL